MRTFARLMLNVGVNSPIIASVSSKFLHLDRVPAGDPNGQLAAWIEVDQDAQDFFRKGEWRFTVVSEYGQYDQYTPADHSAKCLGAVPINGAMHFLYGYLHPLER